MLNWLRKRIVIRTKLVLDKYRIGRSSRLETLLSRGDWQALAALPPQGVSWRDRWKDRDIIDFGRRMTSHVSEARKIVFLREHHMFGRVEEFHHFMGAVVLPFLEMVSMNVFSRGDLVIFPDCGYLNNVVSEISKGTEIDVDFYPIFISDILLKIPNLRILNLPPHDASSVYGCFLSADQLASVRRVALRLAGIDDAEDSEVLADERSVLLIERAPPDPYYLSDKHRNPVSKEGHSGSARRSIANAEEIRNTIAQRFDATVVHLERMSFSEQVRAFHRAAIIVGQHGAGLNGVLWARRGGCSIEIIPSSKITGNYAIFGVLASAAGLRHRHVVQSTPHGPVDVELIMAAIESARPVRDRPHERDGIAA